MKTSEEMARSVIGRAKAKRAAQKRNLITGAAALICVCGIGVGAWMAGRTPANKVDTLQVQPTDPQQTQPEDNVQLRPVRLSLLSFTPEGKDVVILENGIKTPGQGQIRIKDIRGMTEDEIQAAYEAEQEYGETVTEQVREYFLHYGTHYSCGPNGMVSFISAGCLVVPVEDSSLVENVRVTVIGNGKLVSIAPSKEHQSSDEYPKEYVAERWHLRNGGVVMVWMLSADMRWKLCNDPTIPLTSIASTITTTVNMKDGTQVTSIVDVTVDDEGFVYFTSRSETTV
jgi:hypothetical protein